MRSATPITVALLVVLLATTSLAAQQVVRVPADAPDLATAIARVPNGGIIELSPGTYPSPAPNGFRIRNPDKAFTVRSAAGGRAVLTGQNARPVLTIDNGNRSRAGLVTFEGITFRAGRATTQSVAGGVTVRQGEARFTGCVFEDNATRSRIIGAGLSVGSDSDVTVEDSVFRRNTNDFLGGGMGVVDSTVTVRGSRFEDNRVAVPGHEENSSGAGVFVLSSSVSVVDSVFENNRAALVGGGLFVIGLYRGTGPDATVRVERSTFRGNEAFPDDCCPTAAPSGSGAIHVEDNARLTVTDSFFVANQARFGGAIGSFRAEVVVEGSIFEGNRAREPGAPPGLGGAIGALSSAGVPDGREPTRLTVRDSFFQGGGDVQGSAQLGGCVHVGGDAADLAAGNGGLAANRASVSLDRVAFSRCTVFAPAGSPSFGGALSVELADLDATRVLFLDSEASGTPAVGGGVSARGESDITFDQVTFAGNQATSFAGGLLATEAPVLSVTDSLFFRNRVGAGAGEAPASSRGAAIYTENAPTAPGPGRTPDARGTVSGSLFADQEGIEIRDREISPGANAIRYLDSRFFTTTFGPTVYAHNPVAPVGVSASALNSLTIPGTGDKGSGNAQLTARPRTGDLLVFPAAGARADEAPARVAYAWSGNRASLDVPAPGGVTNLAQEQGTRIIEGTPGDYILLIDGVPEVTETLDPEASVPPLPPGPFLAAADLPGFRFKVQIAAAGEVLAGRQEPDCISETVCVSGAVPGRAEAFLRVVGPRPNGFLQPILVKFSTSEVRIWIEQVSTGELRYYELPAVDGSAGRLLELAGLVDRTGFLPAGQRRGERPATTVVELSNDDALAALGLKVTTQEPPPPIPPGGQLTSGAFPGFRFTVRISAAGDSRLGTKESACLPETLCVSGAIPGRSEVFLRVVGPKPNGFLQPTIVRFSTSTIEVWIERPSTGEVRYYNLPGVTSNSGDRSPLDGAIDREGFLP